MILSSEIPALLNQMKSGDSVEGRLAIEKLEKELLLQEQVEVPLQQVLHAGIYCRAITMPKGSVITGKLHLYDHVEIMASGKVIVTTDKGGSELLEGFNITTAYIGKKRAFYAVEETVWVTFHSVGDTGVMGIEDVQKELVAESLVELENHYILLDNYDYKRFLNEQGLTEDQTLSFVENISDIKLLDLNSFNVILKESSISGKGLFTEQPLEEGDFVMPARLCGQRTQAGRYVNHSVRANCSFILKDGNLCMFAIKNIEKGEELTVNYRDVVSYREMRGDL